MLSRFTYGVFLCAALAVTAQAQIPTPSAWWTFDNADGDDNDGLVQDQGSNDVDLVVSQFNGFPPTSFVNFAPEHYVPSGATFTGAGSAYHLEGGISREYNPSGTPPERGGTLVEPIHDDFFSFRDRLRPGTFPDISNPNLDSVDGQISYSFWLNVPERMGADFNSLYDFDGQSGARRYDSNFANRHMLLGRSSDPSEGGNFGGQIAVRTIPGFDPNDPAQFADPTYVFELRGRGQNGGGDIQQTSNAAFQVGEWNHFVITYDQTESRVYMNGELADTLSLGTDNGSGFDFIGGNFTFNNVGFFGAQQREAGNFFIDDFGLWQGTLSDEDVSRIFNEGIAGALTPGRVIPEPTTIVLLGTASLGLLARRRRK